MRKNILNKIIIMLLIITCMLFVMTIKSNAASLSISTSKSSVSPGESFTVTVSVSGGAGSVTTSVSNGSGGKTDFLDNASYSFTCKAGNSGTVTISASGVIGDYTTEQDQNKSASKSVTIVQPVSNTGSSGNSGSSGSSTTKPSTNNQTKPSTPTVVEEKPKSTDSTLSALTIAEGAITPEFNKDVREYFLKIPYETTELNVTATPTDSKAKADIKGNKDLKEGENTVTVAVTAEDGSNSNYLIRVVRARVPLGLKSLAIKYLSQSGEIIESPLNPEFNIANLEYSLQDLEYWVDNVLIEGIPNIDGAEIDIQGAENLSVGENTITITLKAEGMKEGLSEGQEPEEETVTYIIKINKAPEPTLIAKVQDWFKGLFGGVTSWVNDNAKPIILYSIALCVIALFGLSIYIIVDYNKYKDVIAKLKKVNEMNSANAVTSTIDDSTNIESIDINKEVVKEERVENIENDKEKNDGKDRPKGGRHF